MYTTLVSVGLAGLVVTTLYSVWPIVSPKNRNNFKKWDKAINNGDRKTMDECQAISKANISSADWRIKYIQIPYGIILILVVIFMPRI